MKNYMNYVNIALKETVIKSEKDKSLTIIYDLKDSNFITDYTIKDDKVIVHYGDGSIQKYPNNDEVINFLEYQLLMQAKQISKLYQSNLIPSTLNFKRNIIVMLASIVFYHCFENLKFEQIYYLLNTHPYMPYQLALLLMTIGIVAVPKITELIEGEEIKGYAAKIDYYYKHHDKLNEYFGKNNNETINEVEQLKLKKLIKIVKEMEK